MNDILLLATISIIVLLVIKFLKKPQFPTQENEETKKKLLTIENEVDKLNKDLKKEEKRLFKKTGKKPRIAKK